MFSQSVAATVSRRIAATRSITGEEVVVVTVERLASAEVDDAVQGEANRLFAVQGVRGTLIYVDREDRRDAIVAQPDAWFSAQRIARVKSMLESAFASGAYDRGLERATSAVLDVYLHDAQPASNRSASAPPRLRVYAIAVAALLAYLLAAGALRAGRRMKSHP